MPVLPSRGARMRTPPGVACNRCCICRSPPPSCVGTAFRAGSGCSRQDVRDSRSRTGPGILAAPFSRGLRGLFTLKRTVKTQTWCPGFWLWFNHRKYDLFLGSAKNAYLKGSRQFGSAGCQHISRSDAYMRPSTSLLVIDWLAKVCCYRVANVSAGEYEVDRASILWG